MKNLLIRSITILSEMEKSAQQFVFHEKNLLLSEDNDAGKSTLVDMIMWTLGCSPKFKPTWSKADAKSILEVEKNGIVYLFGRDSEHLYYKISTDLDYLKFDKASGNFADIFSKILDTEFLKIEDKHENLISPHPEFYLAPMYIDQSEWNTNVFSTIKAQYIPKKQYDQILDFYTGLKPAEFFEIKSQLHLNHQNKKAINTEIESLDKSRSLIGKIFEIDPEDLTLDLLKQGDFNDLIAEIEGNFSTLLREKVKLLTNLTDLYNSQYFYEGQLKILEFATKEIEKDYIDAVENEKNEIVCPVCLVHHTNSLEMRSRLLADNEDIMVDFSDYRQELDKIKKAIADKQKKLKNVEAKIDLINGKYVIDKVSSTLTIEKITSLKFSEVLDTEKRNREVELKSLTKDIKSTTNNIKKLVPEDDIEAINNYFKDRLQTLLATLNVNNSDISHIKTPTDYKKLNGGKGSEEARTTLALYISLWLTISRADNLILPIFIDTFNQNEQDMNNYPAIVKVLLTYLPKKSQIFICARQNPLLNDLSKSYNIIELRNPILSKDKYDDLKEVFRF